MEKKGKCTHPEGTLEGFGAPRVCRPCFLQLKSMSAGADGAPQDATVKNVHCDNVSATTFGSQIFAGGR